MLPGISRQTVIELAAELGIPCREADLDLYDAYAADEAFLTSTSLCMCPVRSINGMQVGGEEVFGPVTRRLIEALPRTRRLRLRRAVPSTFAVSDGTPAHGSVPVRCGRRAWPVARRQARMRPSDPNGRAGHERKPGPDLHRRAQRGDQGARARLRGGSRLLSRYPVLDPGLRRGRHQGVRVRPDPALDRPNAASDPRRDVARGGVARHRGGARASRPNRASCAATRSRSCRPTWTGSGS